MKWEEIPKIDAHIHIIPDEVRNANPDAEDEFSYASVDRYQKLMDQYNVSRAIVMPFNDPWLMSMAFTADAAHKNLLELCQKDKRFCCFADVDVRNAPEKTCNLICKAFTHKCVYGIKLHPNNSGMNLDDKYNDRIAECAVELDCPVAVHSYPSSARELDRQESCAPARIEKWLQRHPGLKTVICHLGGFQWEDAVKLNAHFDISAILPDYVDRYGVKKTNAILRNFGVDRLLFATDWPCSRSVEPAMIYDKYMEILNLMDFTEEEMHKIAHANAERLFGIQ